MTVTRYPAALSTAPTDAHVKLLPVQGSVEINAEHSMYFRVCNKCANPPQFPRYVAEFIELLSKVGELPPESMCFLKRLRKGLFRQVWGMWARCTSEKVIDREGGEVRDFGAIFRIFTLAVTQVLVIVSGFHPRTTPKTLDLGPTKGRSGFSTLKSGAGEC